MRMTRSFLRTLRQAPSDAEIASHRLLVRAGFIRQLGAGIYSLLPLGRRAIERIHAILREEMNAIGGQEASMPVVNPADVWKESGRYYQIGPEMARFQDRSGRDMVLAMTHEEVVADLVRGVIDSYRQLPVLLYHIQTKWRDDPRPRAGLIRVREFTMKDSYSLDADEAGLDVQYRAHYQAYFNIFGRCGLPTVAVRSDVGMMGGSMAHEFMYLTPVGEDTLILCDACGYTANRQVARFRKPAPEAEEARLLERVETPGLTTIESLADFLGVPESRTAKAVFRVARLSEEGEGRERLVFAVVRGDMELNETKLANAIGAVDLRPARDEEIRAADAVPGYASPIGVSGVLVVVDDLIAVSPNLVAGANEDGVHLLNVNHERDYLADRVADIAAAEAGYACSECGAALTASRGVEVGNIFKLGTRYSEALGCRFLDPDGRPRPVVMGSYGIGSGRLLACVAEEHHDDDGLIWPITVAPYPVHLISLPGGREVADDLYEWLREAGLEPLYDDRDESAGVKFKDADLIGLPIRLTAGARSLSRGGVELKLRRSREARTVAPDAAPEATREAVGLLEREIAERVREVPFRA